LDSKKGNTLPAGAADDLQGSTSLHAFDSGTVPCSSSNIRALPGPSSAERHHASGSKITTLKLDAQGSKSLDLS